MEPGDAVFFHMLTLHHTYGVSSAGPRRRALSLRFIGDDIVHAPRPWRTSPPFEGLRELLAAGAPLHIPEFPLLRPRSLHASAL
jgi:ectoine hydroxylase-related dioxygenase (phytanoyl-CoA dioxygenase family)